MRSKHFLWGVLLFTMILGSWIANILYDERHQLSEPVFLKHEMTVSGDGGGMIYLHFLENKKAGKKVTGIQIADYPQIQFQIYPDQRYSHQIMMKAVADIQLSDEELRSKRPITINDILVFYNEGPPAMVPIGEIRIEKDKGMGMLDMVSASGSSGGSGSYSVRATQETDLEKIEYDIHDRLRPWFNLKLSEEQVEKLNLPLHLAKGDRLDFTYQWSIPNHEQFAYEVYRSKIAIHFRTKEGQPVVVDLPMIQIYQLSDAQVKQLVRTRGEAG